MAAALLFGACHALYPFDVEPVDALDRGVQGEDTGVVTDANLDGAFIEDQRTKPDTARRTASGGV